jgi:hypothetical protein
MSLEGVRLRAKLAASVLLGTGLFFPIAALADEEVDFIAPTKVERTQLNTSDTPIDFTKVEISTLTPADRFVNATTPLVVSLGLGSLALVAYTLIQGARELDGE